MQTTDEQATIIISFQDDTTEISQLASTLGYDIIEEFIQHRTTPDPHTYIGIGKLKEIEEFLETHPVDVIILNGELKPTQWFTLEKAFSTQVYDRIRLILQIFEAHAERKEARLQVQLAQLHYERPLVKELIHRSKIGEHPGLMAGGEYQVDDYYDMIKKQTKKIKTELEKIRNDRVQQRKTRRKSGFITISLAGYTNAGKSSLLNLLSGEHVKVEGQLFSTLSTTTRRIPIKTTGETLPILLTDTVGFIDHLPSWIIDAFHSTLEEIQESDLILLLLDSSDDIQTLQRKLTVCLDELDFLHTTAPRMIVLNKTDLITSRYLQNQLQLVRDDPRTTSYPITSISVSKNEGIQELLTTLSTSLPYLVRYKILLPNLPESQQLLSKLYEITQVHQTTYAENNTIQLILTCNHRIKEKLQDMVKELDGTITTLPRESEQP